MALDPGYVKTFVMLLIVLSGGIFASILLCSWLVFSALVLATASWVTRFVVLYKSLQSKRSK